MKLFIFFKIHNYSDDVNIFSKDFENICHNGADEFNVYGFMDSWLFRTAWHIDVSCLHVRTYNDRRRWTAGPLNIL